MQRGLDSRYSVTPGSCCSCWLTTPGSTSLTRSRELVWLSICGYSWSKGVMTLKVNLKLGINGDHRDGRST